MVDIKNFPNSILLKGILDPSSRWSFLENYNILDNIELNELKKLSEKDEETFFKGKGLIREGETEEEYLIISVVEETKLNSFKLIRQSVNAFPDISNVRIEYINDCFTAVEEDENLGYLQYSIEGKMEIGRLDPVAFTSYKFNESQNIVLSWPHKEGPDIPDVSPITGTVNDLAADWLPEELKGVVAITNLSMGIETISTPKVKNIDAQFSFANQKNWSIIPGIEWLQIGKLCGNLSVDYPLSASERFAKVGFGGSLFLGQPGQQGEVKIEVRWPDLAITGNLQKGDVLPLGYLLNEMGLPMAGPKAGDDVLTISRLDFAAEPTMAQKSFSFGITIDNVWKLKLNGKALFELHSISADLSYQQLPNNEKDLKASMLAKMAIGDYELMTSVDYDGDGWQIRAWSEDNLNIYNLVSRLLSTAHVPFTLPEALSDLTLSSADISYNTQNGEFLINGSFKDLWKIENGPKITKVEFSLQYSPQDGFQTKFTGEVVLEKLGAKQNDIALNIEFKYEAGDWYLQGNTDVEEGIELKQVAKQITGREKDSSFSLPGPLDGLTAENLGVYYHKVDQEVQFSTTVTVKASDFPIHDKETSLKLDLEVSKDEENGKTLNISGEMTLEDDMSGELHLFKIAFSKHTESKAILATYQGDLPLFKVISLFDNSQDSVAEIIPNWMSPTMTGATFLMITGTKTTPSKVIFNLKGELQFNLKDMHLVGEFLGDRQIDVGMDMTIVSQSISPEEAKNLEDVLEDLQTNSDPEDRIALDSEHGEDKGFKVNVTLNGTGIEDLIENPKDRAFAFNNKTGSQGDTAEEMPAEPKTKWNDSKKQFGPVFVNKFGVTIEDGKFSLLIDGGFTVGGFTFSLLGLGVKVPLQTPIVLKNIEFGLDGLSLNYTNGDLRIAGGFMAQKVEYEGHICNGYFGEAQLKFSDKTFKAIGCYVHPDKGMTDARGQQLQPSFFLFAVANIPIGGPSFFFITGFAAGFGINSSLKIPSIDKMRNFILLKVAFDETNFDDTDPGANIQTIQQDIVPQFGSYWVAVGLKATHFEVIESFFLVTVEFGNTIEINLLGLMRLKLPPPGDKIVKAELAIRARYLPNQGILSIEGLISPGSYLLNPSVKLSGGFAFYTWLKDYKGIHAGDFVFSLGGYHPKYKPPPHYPIVPRLRLNWQLSDIIVIKGEMYFAVTPNVLMLGGRLDARADLGIIQAWFIAEAHFLVNFSPLHYNATMFVSMGARFTLDLLFVTITKTISFSANVELWGPDFGGHAKIDLSIVQFELSFGAPKAPPPPLKWNEFQKQFLPDAENTVVSSVNSGLIKDLIGNPEFGDYDWILNPTEMQLNLESAIPLTAYKDISIKEAKLGILAMNLEKGDLRSQLDIKIFSNGKDVSEDFDITISGTVNVPISLWGGKKDRKGQLKAKSTLIEGQVKKLKIIPKRPEKDGAQISRDLEKLGFANPKLVDTQVNSLNLIHDQNFQPDNYGRDSISGKNVLIAETLISKLGLDHLDQIDDWEMTDEDWQLMESDIKMAPTGLAT